MKTQLIAGTVGIRLAVGVLLGSAALLPFNAMAIDFGNVLKNSGGDLIKAGTMSEKDIMSESLSAVKYMDSQQASEPADSKYQQRLDKLVARIQLPELDNVKFNFKVYKSEPDNLNAFATPDGSIRFHTALMDKMTDDQVLGVLGHEIGHVVEKHSFKQMRKSLLASAAVRAAAGESEIGSAAYNAGMGGVADKFLGASFSKKDELSADKYALTVLKDAGAPLESMKGAIEVLQAEYGDGGGMMSSHPSSPKRMKRLEKAVAKMNK